MLQACSVANTALAFPIGRRGAKPTQHFGVFPEGSIIQAIAHQPRSRSCSCATRVWSQYDFQLESNLVWKSDWKKPFFEWPHQAKLYLAHILTFCREFCPAFIVPCFLTSFMASNLAFFLSSISHPLWRSMWCSFSHNYVVWHSIYQYLDILPASIWQPFWLSIWHIFRQFV